MAKARNRLSATLDSCKALTRRSLFKLSSMLVPVAIMPTVALASPSLATPLGAIAPTPLGLQLLAAFREWRDTIPVVADAAASDGPEHARYWGAIDRYEAIAERIRARPATKLAHLVDLAILARTSDNGENDGEEREGDGFMDTNERLGHWRITSALLAAAGIEGAAVDINANIGAEVA